MAWTKVEHDLRDKPEVVAIATALNVQDRDLIVGKLIRLWQWFDKHTTNGCARGVTESFIDSLVSLQGFCSALGRVGWISICENGIKQPNFDRHNSKSAKDRALANLRMKRSRDGSSATEAQPEKRRIDKETPTPLPSSLETERFRAAWTDWIAHRIEIRKPLKPTQTRKQLDMLANMGEARAVATIAYTIEKGWQGLREPDRADGMAVPVPGALPKDVPHHVPKVKFT